MSFFTRIWSLIRRPAGYVGKDFEGNYFYEYASTTSDPRRTRRVVRYKGTDDLHEVASRSRELAVQWKAWLTHTRRHPPTLEELQADVVRRERLRHNVALIEERDRNERLRLAEAADISSPASMERRAASLNEEVQDHNQRSLKEVKNEQYERSLSNAKSAVQTESNPWITRPDSDEPQSWAPKAIRRGS